LLPQRYKIDFRQAPVPQTQWRSIAFGKKANMETEWLKDAIPTSIPWFLQKVKGYGIPLANFC
jgi:hypothetical protein